MNLKSKFDDLLKICIAAANKVAFVKCGSCKEGRVSLKLSRFGAGYFFGCSRYPDCM